MPVFRLIPSRLCPALFAGAVLVNSPAWAEDPVTRSVQASGRASAHAGVSAILGVSAVGHATVAVSTVPMAIGGSLLTAAGQASTAAAGGAAPIGTPLPVTDEVITVMSPAAALRQPAAAQPAAR